MMNPYEKFQGLSRQAIIESHRGTDEKVAALEAELAETKEDRDTFYKDYNSAVHELFEANEEYDRLRDALEAIVKHQQTVAGSMSVRSAVTMIAQKALKQEDV